MWNTRKACIFSRKLQTVSPKLKMQMLLSSEDRERKAFCERAQCAHKFY